MDYISLVKGMTPFNLHPIADPTTYMMGTACVRCMLGRVCYTENDHTEAWEDCKEVKSLVPYGHDIYYLMLDQNKKVDKAGAAKYLKEVADQLRTMKNISSSHE